MTLALQQPVYPQKSGKGDSSSSWSHLHVFSRGGHSTAGRMVHFNRGAGTVTCIIAQSHTPAARPRMLGALHCHGLVFIASIEPTLGKLQSVLLHPASLGGSGLCQGSAVWVQCLLLSTVLLCYVGYKVAKSSQ